MSDIASLGLMVRSDGVPVATKRLRELEGQSVRNEGAAARLNKSLMGMAAGFAAVTAATFGMQAIVSTLAGFEKSMAAVSAITGAVGEELQALRDTAKQLGATTEYTASQAADALKFLGMAGWSAAQSMEAIPAVLDLATSESMDLALAADIASNIMSAFGLAASDAAMMADVLAAAASRSNTSVVQLGDGMKYVGPIASALGISISDTAAAMGILSDAGLQGSMAGTGLRQILAGLANTTPQATKALQALGLDVAKLNPATTSLVDIVGQLKGAGLDAATALTVFGDRGAPAVLALIEGAEKLGTLTDGLRNVDGEAKRMADTMRDQLGGDIKGLQSALEGLIIQLGESGLTAMLRGLIQTMTAMARGVTGVMQSFSQFAASIDSVIGVSSTLGGAIQLLLNNMDVLMAAGVATAAFFAGQLALSLGPKIVAAAASGAGSLLMYSASLGATSVASAAAALSMQALRVAISVMLGPVGIAIALIGTLTAAIVMNGRETQRQREIQERYAAMLEEANSAAEGARKRLEEFRQKTGQVSDKVDEATGKVRGFTDALNGLSASNMFRWLSDVNEQYGLYAQQLSLVQREQSDAGMEGVALAQAQQAKARALTDAVVSQQLAQTALNDAQAEMVRLEERLQQLRGSSGAQTIMKQMEAQRSIIVSATAALYQHNDALKSIQQTGIDAFAGDLFDEQQRAAEAAVEKVQEMITGLKQQLVIDGERSALQKEILSNLFAAGLAANDNTKGAQQIRDLTKELYQLDKLRTQEAKNLEEAKRGKESVEAIEAEIRQLKQLNEALMISDEHHMEVAYAIGLENAMREAGINALSAYGKKFAEVYAERDRILKQYETRKGSAGGSDPLSETDRTRNRERFEDLGKDLRNSMNDPFERLRQENEERLKIVADYEKAYTDKTEEAEKMRAEIREQYQMAQTQLMLSSAEQGFGALAQIIGAAAGETSAAYKVLFGISKGFAIAQSAIAMYQAIAEASKMPFPANIGLMAQAAANGAAIVSSIQSLQPKGFKDGGYTGNMGIGQVAGVVHGQEFVAHAEATRRWRPQLEAMNAGTYRPANDNGGTQLNVTIENHAAGVRHEVQQIDEKTFRIIAREEAARAAPEAVAGAIREPNSPVSKALKENISAPRRRA